MTIRQLVLDTETTGLSPKFGDRIMEIALLKLVNKNIMGNHLVFRLKPKGKMIHPNAHAVHGMSNHDLIFCPTFAQIAKQLIDFIDNSDLIIHNTPFDMRFLRTECERVHLTIPPVTVIDSSNGQSPTSRRKSIVRCIMYTLRSRPKQTHATRSPH